MRHPAIQVEAPGGKAFRPQMPIPGVGYIAIFTDAEGNVMGLFQSDSAAAG